MLAALIAHTLYTVYSLQQALGASAAQQQEVIMLQQLQRDASLTVVVGHVYDDRWTVDAPTLMSGFFAGRPERSVVPALRRELTNW
jgi:hypothetical protein